MQSLKCDALNAKASYLLGTSHMHMRCFEDSFQAFKKALLSAEKTNKSKAFQQEIVVELRRAKKAQWQYDQTRRITEHEAMKAQLAELFHASHRLQQQDPSMAASSLQNLDALMAYTEGLALKHERDLYPGDAPEYFICPVSMEIMVDPVSTPNGVSYVLLFIIISGLALVGYSSVAFIIIWLINNYILLICVNSYERRCIEEHLHKNGPVDPLTRQKLSLEMLRPNTALRSAIQDFLEENPWAFEH